MFKHNIGIIGSGQISSYHIQGFQNAGGNILMIADSVREIAESKANAIGCLVTQNYYDVVNNDDIDAIVVCVPNYLHFEVCMAAIEAGKAVLCEKPMTGQATESSQLLAAINEKKSRFQMGYMKRHQPAMTKFKELIPQVGALSLGQLRCFQPVSERLWTDPGRWEWKIKKDKSRGGALIHSGSHMLDLLHWYLGDIERIYATALYKPNANVEYCVTGIMEFINGVPIQIEVGWFDHNYSGYYLDGWEEVIQLRGSNGYITLYPTYWSKPSTLSPRIKLYREDTKETVHFSFEKLDYFTEQAKRFLELINSDISIPKVTAEDGLWIDTAIEKIYQSAKENRVVFWSEGL